jgi:hypothetical protein
MHSHHVLRLADFAQEDERRALEALALEEFKLGHLTRPELRRLLGFGTRATLDEFLTAHQVFGTYTPEDLERTAKTCNGSASEVHVAPRRRHRAAQLPAADWR